MLNFCLHSLFRQYGWQFTRNVTLPHPVRTTRAFVQSTLRDVSSECLATPDESPTAFAGPQSVVGVGFCLKPLDPPCPSGRGNHRCLFFEKLQPSGSASLPEACRICAIRDIGLEALQAGATFYVMTSARDILFDVYSPALNQRRFTSGLFVLCRYSFRPFDVGLRAAGIRGWMIPFERGDCRDYPTWLRADNGEKDEQTVITPANRGQISAILSGETGTAPAPHRYIQHGNLFVPEDLRNQPPDDR